MTPLSRRELLTALFGAPLASSLLAIPGCDEPAAPEVAGSILGPSMKLGHRLIRDHGPNVDAFRGAPERKVGVAIVGGGPAGLSAAWRLHRRGMHDYVVLELEDEPGGTSAWGRTRVTRHPWGAHYVPAPLPENTELIALLREMGVVVGTQPDGMPEVAEQFLVVEPEERIFYGDFWYRGLYLYAGASAADLAELRRFRAEIARWVGVRDGRGRRAFAIPVDTGSDDPEVTALDRITAREWLDRHGFHSKRLRWLANYACRDDYGLDLDHTSAWALVFYWASRTHHPGEDTAPVITWPEGNGALVRHFTGVLGRRVETGRLVVDVVPDGETVRVLVHDTKTGRREVVVADRVVAAMPRFIARRVVRPLREAPRPGDGSFQYGSWMVANLHLDGRPAQRGYPPAWDNVIYDSPALGYVSATHQRGRDFGPTVWTYYWAIIDADPNKGRKRLLEPSWQGWREAIVRDLRRAHPNLEKKLTHLDVWRWGHAMIQPRPGFVWGRARKDARAPEGRIHFAHSDLSGLALFEEAFHHGLRAADEILAARAAATVHGGGAAPSAPPTTPSPAPPAAPHAGHATSEVPT